jgi:hypothetical protein
MLAAWGNDADVRNGSGGRDMKIWLYREREIYLLINNNNAVASIHKRTKETLRPPLVGEVNANFLRIEVPHGQSDGSLRPSSRLSIQEFY